jgi:2-polyprenyl-3-methyl-5-hydroxy-6-metoxy-1,4-benzoquinol methylase
MRLLGHTPSGEEQVTCALCDGAETRLRYRKFDSNLVQCRQCGLVYVNPRHPKEVVWQRYNPDYFTQEYLPAQGVIDGKVDLAHVDGRYGGMMRLLARELPAKGRLFELGAGAGLFLAGAQRAGWQVSGVELSSAGVAFARERLGVDVTEHSAETMPLDVEPYDAVVLFDVIEHLYDPVSVLRTLKSICRPGGLIAVSTPNFDALSRQVLGAAWSILSPLEHLYYFQEPTLQRALETAGFSAVRFERQHFDWSVHDTMNARATHAPGHWRSTLYGSAVNALGPVLYRTVQAAGRGDILLALGRA